MMRVLLTAAPSIGHIAPMVGVATALRDAGHDVRLATHPTCHFVARHFGLDVFAAGMSEPDMLTERRRRWPESEQQPPATWGVRMFTQILAPAMAHDLLPIVQSWRPQLIIHEEGEYAGPAIAARTGVPCVTQGWGSPLRPLAELATLEREAVSMWETLGIDTAPAAGLYHDGLLNPCPPFLQANPPGAATAWSIRPAEPPPFRHEPAPHRTREPERPVAYIGFGTVAHFADAPDEITAAVSAVVDNGLDAVVTTTDESLHRELALAHGDRVDVHRFVALRDLLPRCQLVICHAGAGTVLASLAAGVPLVLAPRGAPSQQRMAEACVNAGLAQVANPTDMHEIVSEALQDDKLATGCAEAARAIAAMPTAATVIPALERIVSEQQARA